MNLAKIISAGKKAGRHIQKGAADMITAGEYSRAQAALKKAAKNKSALKEASKKAKKFDKAKRAERYKKYKKKARELEEKRAGGPVGKREIKKYKKQRKKKDYRQSESHEDYNTLLPVNRGWKKQQRNIVENYLINEAGGHHAWMRIPKEQRNARVRKAFKEYWADNKIELDFD